MFDLRRMLFAWLWAGLAGCASVGLAEEGPITRPKGEGGGPTKVFVAMGLLDVDEIDGAAQSFTVNVIYQVRWHDPRLAHPGPGDRIARMNEVWHPQMLFVNQQKIWPTFPEVVRIAPDGTVEYRQRVWGPFSQPLEVRDFPFDSQDFEIRIACADARPEEVLFEQDPETFSGLAEQFSLPDWRIVKWELNVDPYQPVGVRRGAASFALMFYAKRYASHYVVKVILPLVFIVAMSWIVFWIDPTQSGTQIGVATTSMLTLIAYRFMVGGSVPTVPYLTRMDYFILGSTVLVFTALIQVVVTSIVAQHDRTTRARRIDRWCRVVFPIAFVGIMWFSLVA